MRVECSRCKKIYDEAGQNESFEYEAGYLSYLVSKITFNGFMNVGIDSNDKNLCPECTYKLREWIDNVKS